MLIHTDTGMHTHRLACIKCEIMKFTVAKTYSIVRSINPVKRECLTDITQWSSA